MKIVATIFASALISGLLTWSIIPRGGQIVCRDGQMAIHFSQVEGLDPKAVIDALFYLCDPDTIGFGYLNQKIRPIAGTR